MTAIRFGTDGWRGVIGEDFTAAQLDLIGHAYASFLQTQGEGEVVVGYDTRFLGHRFAARLAHLLAEAGFQVRLPSQPLPTPVLSFATRHRQALGGVMLTASHNPPEYNGLKFKGPYGGSATPELVAQIERHLGRSPELRKGEVEELQIRSAYFEQLAQRLDMEALRQFSAPLYHEAMGGSSGGWVAAFVRWAKLPFEVRELHPVPHPLFYGVNPEPIPANLETLRVVMGIERDPSFAMANDGDADRLGVVLAGGRYLDSHQIFLLLLQHLARRGLKGKLVKTISTSRLVDLLARDLGFEVLTTPVGFKHIVRELLQGNVLIGGEESGGFAVAGHIPERDGLLNGLLLAEMVASEGKPLGTLYQELEDRLGFAHHYERLDLPVSGQGSFIIERLREPPADWASQVERVQDLDGVRWDFHDGSWLMFRFSGTEPLLRIYCEAPSPARLQELLERARALI